MPRSDNEALSGMQIWRRRPVNKKTLRDVKLGNNKVVMRVDFNVPIDDGKIMDDTRIQAALPTIRHILDAGSSLVLMSHLGRPTGTGYQKEFSLAPVGAYLTDHCGLNVTMASDCIGDDVAALAAALKPGAVLLLENTRFHTEEVGKVDVSKLSDADAAAAKADMKKRQNRMAQQLAALGDIYVNDAFGAAHRAHASTAVITSYTSTAVAGFLMEKELQYLGAAVENPERPVLAIVGGAKISGKLELLLNLIDKVDAIIIGGGMSYTFKKALGEKIGTSICEDDLIPTALKTLESAKNKGRKILLPVDNVLADRFDADANTQIASGDFPDGWEGVDIGPKSITLFCAEVARAKTIIWNGPMGCFEMAPFAAGTNAICRAVADSGAVSIIGGGDSVSAVRKCGLYDKMSHVSTGGGASLEFLEGKALPGVEALDDANES